MDFIFDHPTISKFLLQFPSEDWKSIIITTILNGIPHTQIPIKNPSDKQQSSLPQLKEQLNSMKEELERLNKSLEEPKNSLKSMKKAPPEIKTPKKVDRRNEETPRFQKISPHKNSASPIRNKQNSRHSSPARNRSMNSWKTNKPPMKPRVIPKYLQNVDSKIKVDVQKDIANYKTFCESMREESPEKSSLSLIDFLEKPPSNELQRKSDLTPGKSNSFTINSEARLNTLEGTFTKQTISHKVQSSDEIPLDKDFDTPRYPTEFKKDPIEKNPSKAPQLQPHIQFSQDEPIRSPHLPQYKSLPQKIPDVLSSEDPYIDPDQSIREEDLQPSNVLQIADNFLSGPLMSEFCSFDNSSERSRQISSQQVPPLDLLGSDENFMTFRQRWDEAIKNIRQKLDTDSRRKDYRKNTTSREYYSGRSSGMMMVQTPSPIPYDNKLGPMCQDASYSKYF
jgi:hypothetical protein